MESEIKITQTASSPPRYLMKVGGWFYRRSTAVYGHDGTPTRVLGQPWWQQQVFTGEWQTENRRDQITYLEGIFQDEMEKEGVKTP